MFSEVFSNEVNKFDSLTPKAVREGGKFAVKSSLMEVKEKGEFVEEEMNEIKKGVLSALDFNDGDSRTLFFGESSEYNNMLENLQKQEEVVGNINIADNRWTKGGFGYIILEKS